jgi:large subunit ribosomal protein L30
MSKGVIVVEQTGSPVRTHYRKKRVRPTLVALRLDRIGRVAWLPNTPETRGMIARISHIARVVIDGRACLAKTDLQIMHPRA